LFVKVCFAVVTASLSVPCVPAVAADVERGFVDRVFKDSAGEHKYVLFVPENYSSEKKWPIVLFLHGAYERGEDGRKQVEVGLGPYVKARSKTFPFLVVFPQARQRTGVEIKQTWSPGSPDGKLSRQILDSVEKDFNVDTNRRVLTGWSMGGYGVWQQAAADPQRYSAIVPISGGGKTELAKKLIDMPVWAFHGADDPTVKPDETRALIAALNSAGGHPRYSEIADVEHFAFNVAYDNDALFRWMLHPTLVGGDIRVKVKPGVRTVPNAYTNEPFRPAVEIPGALVLRIGADALEAISYSIPAAMPPNLLSGRIGDIYETTVTSGRTFGVTFSAIRYSGKLHRAYLKTTADGHLSLQLGLQNLRLQIGATYVRGSGRSATTGPMSIVIGHRRPVWLSIEADPYVEKGKVRLRLRKVKFQIPNDNWSVSAPTSVRARGLGMTRSRVRNGIVSGVYGSKSRIESEVRAVVPAILKRVEAKLDLDKIVPGVSDFWPLPVYGPRIKLFAEKVTVDETGVSLAMGLMAAAIDPSKAPDVPKRVPPVGAALEKTPRTRDLRLHIAAGALSPLTDLLIQADVARIHVNDIPHEAFTRFADREALMAAIPDLKQLPENTEIWSELILAKPLSITNRSSDADDPSLAGMQFNLPTVIIATAIKTDPQSTTWQPYAEFRFSLSQAAQAKMLARGFRKRHFVMDWKGKPLVSSAASFSADYTPKDSKIDTEKITALFTQCWQTWADSGPVSLRQVDDIDLGESLLRLSSAGWSNPHLYLGFLPPGFKLTNSTDSPLIYETKGPYSRWGGPYSLPSGESHESNVNYPVLFRRRVDGKYQLNTLYVGTHTEYRIPRVGGPPQLFQAVEMFDEDPAADEIGD
jgi:poly(3-hydroxybutyrate) depolymerase